LLALGVRIFASFAHPIYEGSVEDLHGEFRDYPVVIDFVGIGELGDQG